MGEGDCGGKGKIRLAIGKETANERESILDKTRKLRRSRRHLRKKKHVWMLIGCAGSSSQKSSKRLD